MTHRNVIRSNYTLNFISSKNMYAATQMKVTDNFKMRILSNIKV